MTVYTKVLTPPRVRQPIPLVLTALSKYSERTLSKSELERLLGAVELFTFANTGLMAKRSSGGILQMYSIHARELSSSKATTRRKKTIDDLLRKLRDRLPVKDIFIDTFSKLRYSDQFVGDKRLIQYSLLKLMEHIAPSVSLDASSMSIEHIASQSSKEVDEASIASIGNLWFLNAEFNTKLANKSLTDKLAAYQEANTPRDKDLENAVDWNSEVIGTRSIHLAELMWDIVDKAFV